MKAVLFDLDGTLVKSNINFIKMKRKVISFLEDSGVDEGLLNEKMLNHDIEKRAFKNLREKGTPEEDLQKIHLKIAEIMNEVELEALKDVTVMDGVAYTLRALKKKGLKIGVITRSCGEYTTTVMKRFQLDRLVDAVLTREDVTKPKPNPEHALHLMKLLGVKPSDTALVGDHYMDASCAKKAGIRFFLISKKETDRDSFQGFDYTPLPEIKDILFIF